jgi:chemotaxis protein MotB
MDATRVRLPLLCLGALLLGACVSKPRHEEALAEVKYYQRAYQDLESYQGKLEAENERLRGELALREGEPIEAGLTRDVDERLAELTRIMEGLGSSPGDVTVLAVEGGYGLRLSDAILFDSGSSELKAEGRALLQKMAEEIRSRPFERVWVRGHTDSDPVVRAETKRRFPHGNLQLSAARAIEVAALLGAEGGIGREKLVVAGFGASDPVAPNTSAGEKSRNRRVEIFVIEEAGGDG